jgi:excisionase family DNA binding protein
VAKQLLTVRDGAERLGLREKTLRRWVALRKIEYIKAGERSVRIPSAEIDRLIEAGRVPRIATRDREFYDQACGCD